MSTNNLFTQTQKMAEEKKRRTFKDQLSSRKFPTLGRNDKSKILEEVLKTSTMVFFFILKNNFFFFFF